MNELLQPVETCKSVNWELAVVNEKLGLQTYRSVGVNGIVMVRMEMTFRDVPIEVAKRMLGDIQER